MGGAREEDKADVEGNQWEVEEKKGQAMSTRSTTHLRIPKFSAFPKITQVEGEEEEASEEAEEEDDEGREDLSNYEEEC